MADDEYPLLNEPNIMLVVLRTAAKAPAQPEDCIREIKANLLLAREEAPPDATLLPFRVAAAFRYLCVAGLLDPDETGRCTLTERGKDVLWANPNGIDSSLLMAFPEFRSFIARPNPFREQPEIPAPAEPSTQFDQGYEAFSAGRGLTDNPYEFDTFAHLEWENGWCEARDQPSDQHPA
jgi:restriction system protein